jgi:GAF domain-containing protein
MQSQADEFPETSKLARRLGFRTLLSVPLIREGIVIGVIALRRSKARLFTERQVALLQAFADQAVIAIENARLLNELHQRTDDLSESLQQQTATADVLKVIGSSPGELQPVFDAMLVNVTRLCEAKFASLLLSEGDQFRRVSLHNGPPALIEDWRRTPLINPHPASALGQAALTKQATHIDDIRTSRAYRDRDPRLIAGVRLGGYRTVLAVPMLKDQEVVGLIVIYRQEVRPFTDKQIELVKNFAAQAVIAIENARLLNELRQRTDDLSESLEQQTATSEVLQVISSSPGDLQPVFEAMLENAVRICSAEFGLLSLIDGDLARSAAVYNVPPALAATQNVPFRIHPKSGLAELSRTKQVVHIDDIRAMPPYLEGDPRLVAMVDFGGARTTLGVPMLKGDALLGSIAIYRKEVRPFSDKQIELVSNFAAQAVIAIENTRLLNELRESLQQQTATAEVLSVINSSPGDLQPVFDMMLEKATALCEAPVGTLWLYDGQHLNPVAIRGALPGLAAFLHTGPHAPNPVQQRQLSGEGTIHLTDLKGTILYEGGDSLARAVADLGGIQTVLSVPLRLENRVLGLFGVYRQDQRPFSEKQIVLIENFAAQAVTAIENARLLNELRQRTNDLSESLEQQTATSEVLRVISSSPGELQPVFDTMLENATRICEASFGNLLLYDGNVFRHVALHNAPQTWAAEQGRDPVAPRRSARFLYRVADTKQVVHIADIVAENPEEPIAVIAGARTLLIVPMLKENELIGVIAIYRQEVRPFNDKQIALRDVMSARRAGRRKLRL